MKRAIPFLTLLFLSVPVFSQFDVGVKAGVTSSSLKAEETLPAAAGQNYDQLKVQATNAKLGFQGGLFARLSLLGAFVQPELLFSTGGGEVTIRELDANKEVIASTVQDQTYNKLDMPIMAGLRFNILRLQAGPVGSLMLSNNSALEAYSDDYKQKFNSMTWGYQVGLGLDLFRTITLDLKYEGSLSKLGAGVEINGQEYDFDTRANQFVLNVGLVF